MPGDQATSQYPIAQVVYNFTYFFTVERGQTSEFHILRCVTVPVYASFFISSRTVANYTTEEQARLLQTLSYPSRAEVAALFGTPCQEVA